MQLPPGLKYDKVRLERALDAFFGSIRLAIEFRHGSWYEEGVTELLYQRDVSFVNADSPKKAIDFSLKAVFPYLRFHGRTGWYNSDYTEKKLCEVATYFSNATLSHERPGFAFFNNDFGGFAPKNALHLIELTGEMEK